MDGDVAMDGNATMDGDVAMDDEVANPPEASSAPPASSTENTLYQPLDSGHFQLRRFSLSPGKFEDPICGALDIVSLDDLSKYDALSYVWGQGIAPASMTIGKAKISITDNLDTALRYLRQRDSSRLLWVDAICINQSDLKEKAEQVKYMGLIYSQAEKAIVWLGSADASFEPVERFLGDLNLKREYVRSFASESKEPGPRRSKSNQSDIEFSLALRAQDRPTSVLRGLLELFSRPYWERVWIIQEISKSSNVEIRFGQCCVHLNPLLLASRNMKQLSERTRTLLNAIVRFRAQEQQYGGLSTSSRMSLFDALIMSRFSLSTDPRDKVYALLGMTSDGSNLVPLPTYTGPVEKVFYDLTNAIIKSQQRSNVILLANWAPLQERFKDAAAWGIDWADLGYHLPPWLTKPPRSLTKFKSSLMEVDGTRLAAKGRSISSRVEFNGTRLVTQGHYIATITEVQGTTKVSLSSPMKGLKPDPEIASQVMNQVTSDLLDRLAPGFRSTTLLGQTEITDALARMIRDVNKGEASADYNISCVEDVLDSLGSLRWSRNPIWGWAREYNLARASEDTDVVGDNIIAMTSGSNPFSRTSSPRTPSLRSRHSRTPSSSSRMRESPKNAPSWKRSLANVSRNVEAGKPAAESGRLTPLPKPLGSPWSPRTGPLPQAAFQFWEDVLSALDAVPEFKLRFGLAEWSYSEEHLILVCDGARPNDKIYQIEHSNLPIVLRGGFENVDLIGEVCISRQETGEWDRGQIKVETHDSLKDPFNDTSKAEELNIMIGKNSLRRRTLRRTPSYESLYEQ